MEKATCKYCNQSKDVCLFIKDRKPFRCRKCYNKMYGNGSFDDNAYLIKHGYITSAKSSKKTYQRSKPRYSELEAEVAKYKSLYENSKSQVETFEAVLGKLSNYLITARDDMNYMISAISTFLDQTEVEESEYERFLKNEMPDILKQLAEAVAEVIEDDEDE